ncbi:MAG: ABC transporter permease [Thermoflexibacter sp.]|jgi:putative ABC transport system permease protein|nr:ABC transporter permease [Thermoflexibacter sp.]
MDFTRFLFNLSIAWEAIFANKIRATLTALGIIFGVSAVIAMLAVGNGAQQEILEQIKLVGVNNIVISPVVEKKQEEGQDGGNAKKKTSNLSVGLTLMDAQSILTHIPNVKSVSPEIVMETFIAKDGVQRQTKLVGVEPAYFQLLNYQISEGNMFNQKNLEYGDQVCIIGRSIQTRFFSKENPIGKYIKCGKHWLRIVGVLEQRGVTQNTASNLGIRNYDMDVYTPLKTLLMRYVNRSLVTKAMIQLKAQEASNGDGQPKPKEPTNYHQIDRLVVQIEKTELLGKTSEIIGRMLSRRHSNTVDYEITIPELLLKQQQRTKDIFNIVLGVIAGISLLVGGIGIMNIMLASVLERIKEIGLRISLGAKKSDIVTQFLCEATLISVVGGLIGIALGVILAQSIEQVAKIPTIISGSSIFVSFFVAASVGIVFGITPARRAAMQDPITSLRYE